MSQYVKVGFMHYFTVAIAAGGIVAAFAYCVGAALAKLLH